jgi:hypothetical protein
MIFQVYLLRVHKVLQYRLYRGILWNHEVEVGQICGLGPFHEACQDSVEDVEIFDLEKLVYYRSKVLVEVVFMIGWN